MVLEEPDIEIGAGVSSKGKQLPRESFHLTDGIPAISRRVPPEAGRGRGGFGGRGDRGRRGGFDGGRHHQQDRQERQQVHDPRRMSPRPEPALPPAVPGFGFQLNF
jgi:protein NRD1